MSSMMENRLPPRNNPSMPPTVLRMSRNPVGVKTVTYKIQDTLTHSHRT